MNEWIKYIPTDTGSTRSIGMTWVTRKQYKNADTEDISPEHLAVYKPNATPGIDLIELEVSNIAENLEIPAAKIECVHIANPEYQDKTFIKDGILSYSVHTNPNVDYSPAKEIKNLSVTTFMTDEYKHIMQDITKILYLA